MTMTAQRSGFSGDALTRTDAVRLLEMARVLTGDLAVSIAIVADVCAEAPRDGEQRPAGRRDPTALTLRVFAACRAADREPRDGGGTCAPLLWLTHRCAQQRAVLALSLHGELEPHQVGSLLGLPTGTVCVLLLAACRDLAPTSRSPS